MTVRTAASLAFPLSIELFRIPKPVVFGVVSYASYE